MKQQKGLIQIPILITIIVGILVIGGSGYFGYTQFKNYQNQQAEKEKQAQELIDEQQKALEEAQKAIEESKKLTKKIKSEGEEKNEEISDLQRELEIEKNKPADLTISAQEINPYLTGVVKISCKSSEGSGSLWNIGQSNYAVLTNSHVVSEPFLYGQCNVTLHAKEDTNTLGLYQIYPAQGGRWNSYTDISLLSINEIDVEGMESLPIQNLNYSISNLRQCPSQMPLVSPVVLIGYPAFSSTPIQIFGEQIGEQTVRTITNGIISSYDSSVVKPYGFLPYQNYFVSAKIDSGNSGGIAFSKDKNGLCVLGIPTWLSIGNYETQGIIQNIHNIFYLE